MSVEQRINLSVADLSFDRPRGEHTAQWPWTVTSAVQFRLVHTEGSCGLPEMSGTALCS